MKPFGAIMVATFVACSIPAHAQSDFASLMKSLDVERNDLRECWNAAAQFYAAETCEPSESVINAAFGKCVPVETTLQKAVVSKAPSMENSFRDWIAGYRSGGREHMASVILDARANTARCK
jgi:hypothetical protein